MSKRSRSDSESSSSSSSSSGSSIVEAATSSVSTAKLPASRNLSNIGYRPPRGFEPVTFSSSSALSQKKLSASKEQQVWAIRIPAGISPSQLDGVVINLPRGESNAPLGTITLDTTSSSKDTYTFHASSSAASKGKGKKTQTSSADSQLIAMAAEGPMEDKEDAGAAAGDSGASELESLKLLVPAGDGKEAGKLVMAPVKVERCVRLSIVSPAEVEDAAKVKATTNRFEEKKLPQQPWHLLKGNFKPAGSRNAITDTAAAEPTASQTAEDAKKEKKRKVKSEADKEEKKSKKSKKE